MRLTYEKLREFKAMAVAHRKSLYERFIDAHKHFNNQNSVAIKVVAEYNFWGGYEYAMLKIEEFKRLKSSNENNPLNKLNEVI